MNNFNPSLKLLYQPYLLTTFLCVFDARRAATAADTKKNFDWNNLVDVK